MVWWKKEEKVAEPTKADIAKNEQMKKEQESYNQQKVIEKSEVTIKKFEARIADLEKKIEGGEALIKASLQAKDKNKAKKHLTEVKRNKDQIINIQGKLHMLEKQNMNIQNAHQDDDFFDTLQEGNKMIEKNANKQANVMEELEKAKELENEAKMNQQLMNGMLEQSDDSDIDEEFARLEAEALGGTADNYKGQFDANPDQPIKAMNQPKKQKVDDVDSMFAELMS